MTRRLRGAVELQAILREGKGLGKGSVLRALDRAAELIRTERRREGAAAPGRPRAAARVTTASVPPRAKTPAPAAPVVGSWQRDPTEFDSLGELHDAFAECQRCPLGKTRTHFVFGTGSPKAKLVFVGEAPGREEDLQGEPFVGPAGRLLNKILAAIGFRRNEVYIANILKCRPPGNRDPQPMEIASCSPILARQVDILRPVVLCTLGSFAARTLLGVNQGISRLRGGTHDYRGIPVIPTYHPAALLRNSAWKRPTWEDVQRLRREYDRRLAESADLPPETTS
jgi:DNA polymerase